MLGRTYFQALRLILRPIARFCLRRSLTVQDLIEAGKAAMLDAAAAEIERTGATVTISKLRVMTGLHRRDVNRIYKERSLNEVSAGYITGVIGRWLTHQRYQTKSGTPRVLTCEFEDSEFNELVSEVSTDVHPSSVLFELERVGAVERSARGLRLKADVYSGGGDPVKIYELLQRDIDYLVTAVEENAFEPQPVPNLHIMTEYDNISMRDLPKIREWLLRQGSIFHHEARNYLSRFDLDLNPRSKKQGGGRVRIGSFSQCSLPPEE
ncbi:MAG: hypothetical protein KDD44_03770 [Bdellovibrionales bacterium]|nr:hypothetical protein [Bdellovibrionales bacterium]